jgi:acyloxyacyl hydrolase
MARNQTVDYPALVIFALIGNDVCHPEPSLSVMTTPEEFEQNVLSSLNYLNSTLPFGSYVYLVGLAQGEILWNTMWNRTHPLGCTYADVYDFLNCLQISPCWGWLNSDPEIRAATGARARELSFVYEKV